MKPRNGLWIGVLSANNVAAQVEAILEFDDHGRLKRGSKYTATPISLQKYKRPGDKEQLWVGPPNGEFALGGYSQVGTLYLYIDTASSGHGSASIIGRFEEPSGKNGVIYGTVLITKGDELEEATLTLTHVTDDADKVVFFNPKCVWACD